MLIVAPLLWLAALFVLVLLRALLRKEWAAAVAWVLLFTVFSAAGNQFAPVVLVGSLIFFGLAVFLLIRFGLLALVTNFVFCVCPDELSPDDPRVCVVCGHQSGRNSADGRDSASMASTPPWAAGRFSEAPCSRSKLPVHAAPWCDGRIRVGPKSFARAMICPTCGSGIPPGPEG